VADDETIEVAALVKLPPRTSPQEIQIFEIDPEANYHTSSAIEGESIQVALVTEATARRRPEDIDLEAEIKKGFLDRLADERTMRNTFFWVFFIFFLSFTGVTFAAIFMSTFRLGLSHLNESYIKLLYGTFVAELAAFVIALGYGLFGLKRDR